MVVSQVTQCLFACLIQLLWSLVGYFLCLKPSWTQDDLWCQHRKPCKLPSIISTVAVSWYISFFSHFILYESIGRAVVFSAVSPSPTPTPHCICISFCIGQSPFELGLRLKERIFSKRSRFFALKVDAHWSISVHLHSEVMSRLSFYCNSKLVSHDERNNFSNNLFSDH